MTIPIPVLALRKRDAALSTLSGEQRAKVDAALRNGGNVGVIVGPTAIFMTEGKEKNAGE